MAKTWKTGPEGEAWHDHVPRETKGSEPFIGQTIICDVVPLFPPMSDPTGRHDSGPRGLYHLSRLTKHRLEINRN